MGQRNIILNTDDGAPIRAIILELAAKGVTQRSIAKKLRINVGTIGEVVRAAGVTRQKSEQQADMVRELASCGLSMRQIGDQMGVTRERVRQILAKIGVNIRDFKDDSPKFPIRGFKFAMYRHLKAAGYCRCCHCGWRSRSDFPPKGYNICRECNTRRSVARYRSSPEWREHIKAYNRQRAQVEKRREYMRRRSEQQKSDPEVQERRREYRREHWQMIKSDPERYAKYLEACKRAYARRKDDPEYVERKKKQDAERYQRRKSLAALEKDSQFSPEVEK